MQPFTITLAPTTGLDRDGVCTAQTTSGAADLTINGALASGGAVTFDVPRKVGVYSAANLATLVFTVVGTDRNGAALSDTVTGVSNSTVLTTAQFATVTKVSTSATAGSNVEVGVTAALYSKWIPLNPDITPFAISISAAMTGTMTYGVEWTNMRLDALREHEITSFQAHATATNKSASYGELSALSGPATAMRFATTAWTSGTLTGRICQGG